MEKQKLERLGYDVAVRTNSIEALETFRKTPDKVDLVITDMTMPNMTGVQLSQKLLEIRPDNTIVICTAFSAKIDDENAKEIDISGFVTKPVVMSEMAKRLGNRWIKIKDKQTFFCDLNSYRRCQMSAMLARCCKYLLPQ